VLPSNEHDATIFGIPTVHATQRARGRKSLTQETAPALQGVGALWVMKFPTKKQF